jgi:chromosome segregation ATPase
LLTLHQQLEKLKLDSEALRRRCADLESQKAKQELRSQEAERSVREAETGTSGQKLSASKETKPDAELTDYVRNLEKKLRETDEMHRDFEFLLQSKDSEIASHNEQVVFLSKELTSAR